MNGNAATEAEAEPGGLTDRPRLLIAAIVSGGFAVALMQTLIVPVLPHFPEILDTSIDNVTWLVTASLLAGAVFVPVLSRLADLYGRRRVLLVALFLMTLGSALGAAVDSLWLLLVARVLQGAGTGVIGIGTSIMRDVLPPRRMIGGVAAISSSLGFGGALGLPLSGLVAQYVHWRWLFAGPAILGVLLIVFIRIVVPDAQVRSTGGFDLRGAVVLSAALLSLLLAISKGAAWGWTSATTLGLLAATAVLLPTWVWLMLRTPAPLIDLRAAGRRSVLLTNAASVTVGFALYTGFLSMPQILQASVATGYGFGLPPAVAGVVLVPLGMTMMLFSPVSAMVSRRFGAHLSLVVGVIVIGVASTVLSTLPHSVPLVVAVAMCSSIGTSLAFSAMPLLVMAGVPQSETSAANGVNTLVRMIGTCACSAFIATVTSTVVTSVDGRDVPSGAAFTIVYRAAAVAAAIGTVLALAQLWQIRRAVAEDPSLDRPVVGATLDQA